MDGRDRRRGSFGLALAGRAVVLAATGAGVDYPCIAVHAFGNAIPLAGALDLSWQAPLLIVGSTLAALTLTRLLALGLGDGQRAAPEGLIHATDVPGCETAAGWVSP